jgi:hypothetical protein
MIFAATGAQIRAVANSLGVALARVSALASACGVGATGLLLPPEAVA